MNPYDFVRIDWERRPERRRPVWHHKLVGNDDQVLYSGHIEMELLTETPFFLFDPCGITDDPRRPDQSMRLRHNGKMVYGIPGSSLKGLVRTLVETFGNGCLTLFKGEYKGDQVQQPRERLAYGQRRGSDWIDYKSKVPVTYQHCEDLSQMCLSCRLFGLLKERSRQVFLGKVNISDALCATDKVPLYEPMYTQPLMEPKPHHAAFYLDEQRNLIAGRKYYFHHSPDYPPVRANGPIRSGGVTNRYIQPLDYGAKFTFRVDFTNLEEDEFAALWLALTLDEDMRHKLGYGKPLGLGSVQIFPQRLTLIDYATRYTRQGNTHGKEIYEGDQMWNLRDRLVDAFIERVVSPLVWDDLRAIWGWPPDPDMIYAYPDKRNWFDQPGNSVKRIADTIDAV